MSTYLKLYFHDVQPEVRKHANSRWIAIQTAEFEVTVFPTTEQAQRLAQALVDEFGLPAPARVEVSPSVIVLGGEPEAIPVTPAALPNLPVNLPQSDEVPF